MTVDNLEIISMELQIYITSYQNIKIFILTYHMFVEQHPFLLNSILIFSFLYVDLDLDY